MINIPSSRSIFTLQKPAQIIYIASLCFSMIACSGSSGGGEPKDENTPPQITSAASASISENSTAALTVTATDEDDDSLTYGINGGVDQSHFGIDTNSGELSFNAPANYEAPTDNDSNNSYLVQVFVSDGQSTVNQLVTVNVDNLNDNAPVFTSPASVSVNENTTAVITVSATDADGSTLNYTVNGGTDQAHFTINASSGVLSFISSPDFEVPTDSDANNIYLVQVRVNDGQSTQDQLISVTVNDVSDNPNTAPTITSSANVTVQENVTNVITVTANDVDDDTLTYGINGGADQARFGIDANSGVLSFNAAPDYEVPTDSDSNNSYLVQVFVNDGQSTTIQLITVNVNNLNDNAPQFTSPASVSVNENATSVITVVATDADGNTLNYTVNGGADQARFAINASSGALSFIVAPDFEVPTDSDTNNVYEVQVNVGDGGNAVNHMMTVTVNDLNEQTSGLPSRPANPTCEIADAPVLAAPIKLTQVFTNLGSAFSNPVVLLQSPVNTDRWYVLEQHSGLVKTFLSGDSATVTALNLKSKLHTNFGESGLLGMAFHPDFANNKFVFIYYSAPGGSNHESVISRFTANNDSNFDLASEVEILRIDQPYGNHNGGNISFGADGFLYIGMGDGGDADDPDDNAQNISSLLGKMLRIDVDNPASGNEYSSPADNPYVGGNGLDEIYATGLRNPWRWSFDRLNGNLILGDVGQSAREEIDFITNGGNYGWPCFEGSLAGSNNTTTCTQQGDYDAPVYEYDRDVGQSVTGGFIYRGSAMPDLYGSYIYSDYFPGAIWGLSDPGEPSQANTTLLSGGLLSSTYISTFAEDAEGELYITSYLSGLVYRLDAGTDVTGNFPELLSETGCIDGTNPLQMAGGLVPYEINAPFWSDGVAKDRWMALPDGATINIEADHDWTFPINSVLVKNFNLNGKRIETRLLVRHADGNWGGYSYEWNDAETDASLLLNGKTTVKGTQTYIYPSSSDCFKCHTTVTNIVLGPETRQLNRDHTYASTGITANQMATLEAIGYFTSPLGDVPANLPTLTDPADSGASLHDRARAYLYTNCSQCHRAGGPVAISDMDFNITTADVDMNVCNVNPTYSIGGASSIMMPGNATDSTMYRRMTCRDDVNGCDPVDKMPPLGSVLVDPGTQVVADWINSLSTCP